MGVRKAAASRVPRSGAGATGGRGKLVFSFGGGRAEGRAAMRDLLGGKGANLAEMAGLGLPVPPGFTITTEVCSHYTQSKGAYPKTLRAQVEAALAKVESITGRRFGDEEQPLLLSVRSGARASMPGMMDTVLNLGLNETTVEALIRESGSARFGYDCYRRFVQMFGDVVLGMKPESGQHDPFEEIIDARKRARRVELDTELDADDLRALATDFKDLIARRLAKPFPEEPSEQLWLAIGAVFGSWNNPRAKTYRKLNTIPDAWGTAVNVQAMVFGNLGDDCATGVAFTRDPSTGAKGLYGEFLVNAQGEDVVAGIRTPQQITRQASLERAKAEGIETARRPASLEEVMPDCCRELLRIAARLEKHYREMQDMEFTIERGRLWMLQTRTGKRTAPAAIKIAVDMVRERQIDKATAIGRVAPAQLNQLLHPQLDPKAKPKPLAKGLPASPGAASGEIVFSADEAVAARAAGRKVVLVRIETSPEDIHGMHVAEGIVTARGGMTSHAAVVARGMGKCCVSGCGALQIDYGKKTLRVGEQELADGDWLTLDGSSGEIFAGAVPTIVPELGGDFRTFMGWADGFRRLRVRANADTPVDAEVAIRFGAEGIGLCRTEHMFFEEQRIDAVREMILATSQSGREAALAKLLPMQKQDFLQILRTMGARPVTIRLLDPPLHEFLPNTDAELVPLAAQLGVRVEELRATRDTLHEANPMLGHRGCRLGITYPEIYRMQARAITEAACELKRDGVTANPEIMIPLVGHPAELALMRAEVEKTVADVSRSYGQRRRFPIGTMIELPRAALAAAAIAREADFFSFGTNDLTQTTLGLSRDDAEKFLSVYVDKGIYPVDPFVSLDRDGVGALIRLASEAGRGTRPGLKLGVCGEHGGDPDSVSFFHGLGLDYVSCSPFRVPLARLAAAQAALGER